MNTDKDIYESPRSIILIVESQSVTCQSITGNNEEVEDDDTIITW